MQDILTRDDIVGKKILRVWQSPWRTYKFDDGYTVESCSTYVELDDNTIFEIQWQDCCEELPINKLTLQENWFEVDWEPLITNSYSMVIIEVLTSNYIPTFCLLLSNNHIIFASDYGPHQTGPLIDKLGEKYDAEDFVTYWGHNKISAD